MKQTGLLFYVEGEYVTESDWEGCDDPGDEEWVCFSNEDIHPFGKQYFTAWSQFREINEKDEAELIEEIVAVVDWLYRERDWAGFNAVLWLHRGKDLPERVYGWEMC